MRALIERLKVAFSQHTIGFQIGKKAGEWNLTLMQMDEGRWDATLQDPEGHVATSQGWDSHKKAMRAVMSVVKDWKGKRRMWVIVLRRDPEDTNANGNHGFEEVETYWKPVGN